MKKELFIGADHAGFAMKEKVKKYLSKNKHEFIDITPRYKEGDDYPEVAFALAKSVVKNNGEGILICGTGAGVCIAANKVLGARASQVYDSYTAKMSREHNGTNIVCLRGRGISFWKTKRILSIWLKEKISNEERNNRR